MAADEDGDAVRAALGQRLSQLSRDECRRIFESTDCCAEVVLSAAEASALLGRDRGLNCSVEVNGEVVNVPFMPLRMPGLERTSVCAPRAGEHQELLSRL